MDPNPRRLSTAQLLDYLLPALIFTFGMQFMRIFIPSVAWYLRDTVGIPTLQLIPYAFGTFLLGYLAAILRRIFGPRMSLWVTAGGLTLIRLIAQLIDSPPVDLWLSIAGMGLFLNFLVIFIGHVRAQGYRTAPRLAYGLFIGLAFDVVLRGVFGTVDLHIIPGIMPLLTIILLVVLAIWAISRELMPNGAHPSEVAWNQALPLMALGPFMVLQVLFFTSQGFIEEVGGLFFPVGFIIVLLGLLAASAGIAWGFARPHSMTPAIALGVTLYLALTVYTIDQSGALVLLTIPLGQFLLGWGWAVVVVLNVRGGSPGLWRTTFMTASGWILFVILIFAFYIVQDIALPIPRPITPAIAGGLVGLFFLSACMQAHKEPRTSKRDFSGLSIITALTLVPLIYWLVIGGGPSTVEPNGSPVKVMTYNIHSGIDAEGRQDLEAIARVIEGSGADIIGLNEVSRVHFQDGSPDMPTWLSQRLDMPYLFKGADLPVWGNALLSRYPILAYGWGELPRMGTLIGRGYLWASVDIGGQDPLLIIVTHLHHLDPGSVERSEQVAGILEFWRGQSPAILLGDLNARPGTPEIQLLEDAGLLDAWSVGEGPGYTYSSDEPVKRIDWLWHTDDLQPLEVEVIQTTASDHLPVLATFDFVP